MKIRTVTEKDVDVTFPQYRKFGTPFYQIVDENNYVGVIADELLMTYEIKVNTDNPLTASLIYADGRPIDKSVFDNAYQKALSKMNQLMDKPETHEERMEREDRQEQILEGARENFALNWREGK